MAEPGPSLSSLFRRALLWLAVALAVALIAREVRRQTPPDAPAPSAAPEAAAPPRDEVLGDLVPALVDALGRRDTRFVMDHVATGFKEERGLDYFAVRSLVETASFSEEPLGVRLDQLELTPLGDGRQRAAAKVAFAKGQRLVRGAPLPDGAVRYAIEVVFAKDGPRWLAQTGSYRREWPPSATTPDVPPTATR